MVPFAQPNDNPEALTSSDSILPAAFLTPAPLFSAARFIAWMILQAGEQQRLEARPVPVEPFPGSI